MAGTASHQTWTADTYSRNARFVSDLGADILTWLTPKLGERILDLGCGDGALTLKIASTGAKVIGVDTSEDLLQSALSKGLAVYQMDGHALNFSHEFDAVFSNAALHWMTRPEQVLQGIARSLKPKGRFVAEFGGHGNVAAVITAMRSAALAFGGNQDLAGPWFFPTTEEYRSLLEKTGFAVDRIELRPRPTPLPTGMQGWLLTFRKVFFDQYDDRVLPRVLDHVISLLKPSLCDRSGQWSADYVRLKVEARLAR